MQGPEAQVPCTIIVRVKSECTVGTSEALCVCLLVQPCVSVYRKRLPWLALTWLRSSACLAGPSGSHRPQQAAGPWPVGC